MKCMADYTVWHLVRTHSRPTTPVLNSIKSIEDISRCIFALTDVNSCVIIQCHKVAGIRVLIEAGPEVKKIVQGFLREKISMGVLIQVSEKKIELPIESQPHPTIPPIRRKNRYQILSERKNDHINRP